MCNVMAQNNDIPPLKCEIFNDVTLLPAEGHVWDTYGESEYALGAYVNGKPLAQVHRYIHSRVDSKQLPLVDASEVYSAPAIYAGIFFAHYGHFLCETVQRLWYAKQNPHLPIVWIGDKNASIKMHSILKHHQKIFSYFGVNNKHIFLQKPTVFKTLHIPEPGFILYKSLHPTHAAALAVREYKVEKGKYVYLSRANFRGCVNERAVENMLKEQGWQICYPEELSIAKQVETLSTAEVCLIMSGSAQHTLLFTKNSKTRYIIIPRVHNLTYELIAQLKSDNYYVLKIPFKVVGRNKNKASTTFSLDINQLKECVVKTNNFTQINNQDAMLTKNHLVDQKYFKIPEFYYTNPCKISKHDELYYNAIYAYKDNKIEQAYKMFLELKGESKLLPYMYERYFQVLRAYSNKFDSSIDVEQEVSQLSIFGLHKELKSRPLKTAARLILVRKLCKLGRYDEAVEQMKILDKSSVASSEVKMEHAKLQEYKGNFDEAIALMQKLSLTEEKNILVHCYLLKLYANNLSHAEREIPIFKAFVNAINKNKKWKNELIFFASKYISLKNLHQYLEKENLLSKKDLVLLQKQAKIQNKVIKQSKFETYKNMIFNLILHKLAFVAFHSGDYIKSAYIARKVSINNPSIAWGHYVLGLNQQVSCEYVEALKNVQKAIELNPKVTYYYVSREALKKAIYAEL